MTNAIAKTDQALPTIITPMELIDRAVQSNAPVETLKGLMDLQERWEKHQARKAFDAAIAEAKAEIPVIDKNRHVGFASKKAGAARTDYWHEDLAEVARVITPILAAHGLSYRYRTSSEPGQAVTVTCIISHRDGHSEENTLAAGRDDTGNKNSIQQIGSTITYLQRYTLKAALGLAAAKDDDGASADELPALIGADDVETLRATIVETGADLALFLKFFEIEKLDELPAGRLAEAKQMLARKKKGAA